MSPQRNDIHEPKRPPGNTAASEVQEDDACLVWSFEPDENLSVKFLPASRFSWEQLTDAYNQTRVDYIVPMPMNVARLREYAHDYDIDLDASVVAIENNQALGLAMLGVRPGHTWPTRVGILPISRQRGLGRLLMAYVIAQSCRLGAEYSILEVIKGNEPAYRLFKKLGFRETRELLILRRPPGPPADWISPYVVQTLDYQQVLERLHRRHSIPSWLDETPSLENAGNLAGLQVELENGSQGWIVYQNKIFQLGHLILETEAGNPPEVGRALLHALHARHPAQDTSTENSSADDPHLPAFQDLRYIEAFRRIEMRLDLSLSRSVP